MKVVAERGHTVLVQLEDEEETPFDLSLGVIVDRRRKTVSLADLCGSILASGYWTPFQDDPEPVLALLSSVGDELTAAAWDESKHQRHPSGDERGGEFAPKGASGQAVSINLGQFGAKLGRITGKTEDGDVLITTVGGEKVKAPKGGYREIDEERVAKAEESVRAHRAAYDKAMEHWDALPAKAPVDVRSSPDYTKTTVGELEAGDVYYDVYGYKRRVTPRRSKGYVSVVDHAGTPRGEPETYAAYVPKQLTAAGWDETKHPREPAGQHGGGRFRAETWTFDGRDYHKVIDTRINEPVDVAFTREEAERKAAEMKPDPDLDKLTDSYAAEARTLKRGARRKIGPLVIGRDPDGTYYSDAGVGMSFGKDPVSIAHWLAGIELNERRGLGAAGWDETKHPREPRGSEHGGEFAGKGATATEHRGGGAAPATVEDTSWLKGPAKNAEEAYYKATQPREAVQVARAWLEENGIEGAGGNAIQVVQAMQDNYPDGYEFFLSINGMHKEDFQRHYKQGDTYEPSRAAYHAGIEAAYMAEGARPPAGQKPVALFMAGGSGSGKGTLLDEGVIEQPAGRVYINPDDVKELLPESKKMRAEGDDRWAALSHEESSDVAYELREQAQAAGFPMVIDGTGDAAPGKFLSKIKDAEAAGYEPKVVLVDIPTDEAIRRAQKRAEETGRKISPETITSIHHNVTQRFTEWRDQVKNWEVWANDDPEQGGRRMIARRVNGGEIEILDPARYAQTEAKANG